MITFTTSREANVMNVGKVLNKYNGSDVELRIGQKSSPITFISSSATGNNTNDSLTIEFIYNVKNGKDLEQLYKYIRSLITREVEVRIGTTPFYALLDDTYRVPDGVSFDDLLESKFYLTFKNVRAEKALKAAEVKKEEKEEAKKESKTTWLQVAIPSNIWDSIKGKIKKPVKDPHITVIHLNRILEEEELAKVKECITSICKNFGPILVKTSKVTCFGEGKDKICVLLLNSSKLLQLNECVEKEIDLICPDLVSKDFSYNPHITLSYSKQKVQPFIPQTAWEVGCIEMLESEDKGIACFPLQKFRNDDKEKGTLCEESNAAIQLLKLNSPPQLIQEHTASSIGYSLSSDLEVLGYKEASKVVKEVARSVSNNPIAKLRTIAGILYESGDVDKAKRCIAAVDKIEIPIDDKIRDALMPYVEPVKLDAAINAVIEALGDGNRKEEVDALGPWMPGTDSHIVTQVKSPQTQDVPRKAPIFSKSLEFAKRISRKIGSGDIVETAARTYLLEEAASLDPKPDDDAVAYLEKFIMHTPSAEELAKFNGYYANLANQERKRINELLWKKSERWVKEDGDRDLMKNKVPEVFDTKKTSSTLRKERVARIAEIEALVEKGKLKVYSSNVFDFIKEKDNQLVKKTKTPYNTLSKNTSIGPYKRMRPGLLQTSANLLLNNKLRTKSIEEIPEELTNEDLGILTRIYNFVPCKEDVELFKKYYKEYYQELCNKHISSPEEGTKAGLNLYETGSKEAAYRFNRLARVKERASNIEKENELPAKIGIVNKLKRAARMLERS